MKKGIHPTYGPTVIRCACGNIIETRSTKEQVTVQICSNCHPFFTGKQKLVDAAGRIERFQKKYAKQPKKTTRKKEAEPAQTAQKEGEGSAA